MTTQYHFTFVNGGADGVALRTERNDAQWNGVLISIDHAVKSLCTYVDERPLFLNCILDWVDGLTAEDVLAKATELLSARGYTGLQWVSEGRGEDDDSEGDEDVIISSPHDCDEP